MSFEEMVVSIIALVGGIGLVALIFMRITTLIKSWIDRKKSSYNTEEFDRLRKEFHQYKKNTERRIQNLEAIIAEVEEEQETGALKEAEQTIELPPEEKNEEKESHSNPNLKNMLRS